MGMGSAPASATVMPIESVRKIVPKEMKALEAILEEHGNTLGALAYAVEQDDWDDLDGDQAPQLACLVRLQKAFKRATRVKKEGQRASCLEIYLGYYDDEKGELYDDLSHEDGAYFSVEGTTQLSPAGKKFRKHYQDERWTVFG